MTSRGLTTEPKQSAGSPAKWKPRKLQKRGVEWLMHHANAGLWADIGAGKTSVVLKCISLLKQEELTTGTLVIAPKKVAREVWPAEAAEWEEFKHLRVVVLHGKEKESALHSKADIYVINPEGLPWLFSRNDAGRVRFSVLPVDTLVVDESSKFKHTNTQRFKLLKPWLDRFRRRWTLTGTPAPNGYMDLFGQIYIVDLGRSLGQYITHFRSQYFYQTGYGGYTWKMQEGADKKIHKAIAPCILRMDTSDYADMPKVSEPLVRRVDLPDDARAKYDAMEEEMFAELDGGANVMALSKGGAMNKCSQIANGGVYYSEHAETVDSLTWGKRATVQLHNAKTEELEELVEELQGRALMIAYEFQHDVERMTKAFPKLAVVGAGSDAEDSRIFKAWNRGDIQLMAGHPASMAHGLNLQKGGCHHVCFYGITWDLEQHDQFIGRVARPGNSQLHIFRHYIVARNTTDEAKMRALGSKNRDQRTLMQALKTYRRARAN